MKSTLDIQYTKTPNSTNPDGVTITLAISDGFSREFVSDLAHTIAEQVREETDRFNERQDQRALAEEAWERKMALLATRVTR